MTALVTSALGRKICLASFFLMTGTVVGATVVGAGSWHFAWLRHGLADVAHEAPLWVAVSIVIFVAASLSSTVGFAFSAIAAAMIFHLVSDTRPTASRECGARSHGVHLRLSSLEASQ